MRLIVAGSRSIPVGVALLCVDAALRVHGWRPRELVCAKADGPATAGETWAKARGVPVRAFFPKWAALGSAAGGELNERMVAEATHLLAIWDGVSTNTADLIAQAKARGLGVITLHVEASAVTAARRDERRRELALERRLRATGKLPRPRRAGGVRSAA